MLRIVLVLTIGVIIDWRQLWEQTMSVSMWMTLKKSILNRGSVMQKYDAIAKAKRAIPK